MKQMIKRFFNSRTCIIWLILFVTSTVFLVLGKAEFTEWAAFNGGTSMLTLIANKAEQQITKDIR